MPAYAAHRLAVALGRGDLAGRRVLVLGVAYRGDVKETAFSGAFPLRDALEGHGAEVVAADPLYDAGELRALGFAAWDGGPVDGAVLQADHAAYRALGPDALPGAASSSTAAACSTRRRSRPRASGCCASAAASRARRPARARPRRARPARPSP